MKISKLTAALAAAVTAIAPVSLSAPALSPANVFAEESGALAELPEWIPTDYDSALEFSNTYGATHIGNGLICIVMPEKVRKGRSEDTYGYELSAADGMGQKLKQEVYTADETETGFDVFVYQPQKQGDLALKIVDPHVQVKPTETPEDWEPPTVAEYTFAVDKDLMKITETDIYGWLPDSAIEFKDYSEKNGDVSIRENYVVFCLTETAGTAYRWSNEKEPGECFECVKVSSCTLKYKLALAGGSVNTVYAYKAVKDGCDKIAFSFGKSFGDEEEKKSAVADCAVYNNAQSIIFAGNVKITLADQETGEPIVLGEGEKPSLWTNIVYNRPEGAVSTGPVLIMEENPLVDREIGKFLGADSFSIGLSNNSLPESYKFSSDADCPVYHKGADSTDERVSASVFDNGSADIVFKLKKKQDAPKNKDNTVKFIFTDADTGELLSIKNGTAFQFSASICANYNGQSFLSFADVGVDLKSNPFVWDISENAKAGLKLSDIKGFYINPVALPAGWTMVRSGIKKTVYENNSMDVTVPLKKSSQGDVNKDGEFNVSDMVLFQKWLLAAPDAKLADWKAADFTGDGKLNAFDLCLMRRGLFMQKIEYVEPDVRSPYGEGMRVLEDGLKMYLGPDESYEAIAALPETTRLRERGYNEDNYKWVFTEYNGMYGWIRIAYDDGTHPVFYDLVADKPVIYLYPEEDTDVHVELELTEADLSTTYPKYRNGWDVTAYPDGTLLNKADGTHHRYLFWDAVNCRTRYDLSKGFCVAGSDTESFLKEKLTYMGLTEDEMNEFIVYWLPRMEHNAYNLITFQSNAYTDSAKLDITPSPDSLLRVFMAYVPLESEVDTEPQQLETFQRNGFTVVEWGGCEIE